MRLTIVIAMLLPGCGGAEVGVLALVPLLLQNDGKTRCSDDNEFRVCLSTESSFASAEVESVILASLNELNELVNSNNFHEQINERAENGGGILGDLLATNYIVRVTGYCEDGSSTLAQAEVNGFDVAYNECTIDRASDGSLSTPHVSGVMLHEISHNIGYSHAKENPDPDSVPFFLGDLAEELLSPEDQREAIRSKEDRPWRKFNRQY